MIEGIVLQVDTMGYVVAAAGAAATVIGAMGLKELWPHLFNNKCEKNLIRLSAQVAMLFNIMRDKFKDEPRVQEGMDDIQEFIKELNGRK